jgi:group II intron reverse transcriptase/maturase
LTALWHHVYAEAHLHAAYWATKPKAAAGVDGVTWYTYGANLDANLKELAKKLQKGAYRARPVKRVYIPKPDGRQRPIGITALEDKIVQRAVAEVLNAVYESEFKEFSYGFRPGRRQHNALDAVWVGIMTRKINWVFDADIRGFFDTIDHEWLIKFIEHRIGDRRIIRHITKWLKAGVMEEGEWRETLEGSPQGGSISPVLANIYLHYVYDLWAARWRRRDSKGEMIIIRYADDIIMGFQHERDARIFHKELTERMQQFGLELHPEKTRLIEFGRYALERREKRGKGKPETFTFLGFTHACGTTRKGEYTVRRKPISKRMSRKLKAIKQEVRRRIRQPIPEQGKRLRQVITGYYQYFSVPGTSRIMDTFRKAVSWIWYRALRRRSQKTRLTWERMLRLIKRRLPSPRIVHPCPLERLRG